ncbi:transporter substrate-binding domain-containing protein, partial [bacterium]|nr:transporter substrate-binding domain-containing protein [bacterium]
MEKIRILKKQLFLFCVFAGIAFSSIHADTITIAADEWCPYNCEVDSSMPGYTIEIASAIFEKNGHHLKYIILPWARALASSRNGKYTGVVGAYKEDAPDFIFPEESFGFSKNSFFVKKGSTWRYKGIKSLDEISIGIIRDYSYGAELDKYFKDIGNDSRIQVVSGTTALENNIKKLI